MTKALFAVTTKYKSGMVQMVKGSPKEVKVVNVTLNKKSVPVEMRKLNNHDSILTENEHGGERIIMLTTQEKSKTIVPEKETKDVNVLITRYQTICGNKSKSQYISQVCIDPEKGTVKYAPAPKAEEFSFKNAQTLVDSLNVSWGKDVVNLINIKNNE